MVIGWFCLGGSALGIALSINYGHLALLDFLLVLPPVVAILVLGLCPCNEAVLLLLRFCQAGWFFFVFAGSVGSRIDCVLSLARLGKYSKVIQNVDELELGGGTSGHPF